MQYSVDEFHLGYSLVCIGFVAFFLILLTGARLALPYMANFVLQLLGLAMYSYGYNERQSKRPDLPLLPIGISFIVFGGILVWFIGMAAQWQSMKLETEVQIGGIGLAWIGQGLLWILEGFVFTTTAIYRIRAPLRKETEATRGLSKGELYEKVLEAYLSTYGGGFQRFETEIKKLEKTGLNREQAIHRIAEQLGM